MPQTVKCNFFKKGAEERGCVSTVKKARIYVHVQLQRNSSSTQVVNTRYVHNEGFLRGCPAPFTNTHALSLV
jgi:hypothetical protein